jgi:tripartite-type tricarboxylate transporter receptor subunit TctC
MPDVPTLRKAGVNGAESGSWIGLLAPAGTPKDVVDKLSQGLQQAVADARRAAEAAGAGRGCQSRHAADFAQLIANDRKRYARIIIDNKLTID